MLVSHAAFPHLPPDSHRRGPSPQRSRRRGEKVSTQELEPEL